MKVKFSYYEGKDGDWYWHAKAGKGKIVADGSEGYDSKGNVIRALNDFLEAVGADSDSIDVKEETKLMHSIQDGHQWAVENEESLKASFQKSPEVPGFMKSIPTMQELWNAGCWLNEMMQEMGIPEEKQKDIGFCHGQRSFGNDPWVTAVQYLQELEETQDIEDKPGSKLADEINKEVFGE
jgi:uncharacterized protein YegP (UPF0339 family)